MTYKPQILKSSEGGTGAANTATSGKILIGDGNNFVTSTPSYPNSAGTSGNFLVSNGTNFVSTSLGNLTYVTFPLTNAQIKALHGTPVQVIAAPGSGKVTLLVSAASKMSYGGNNVFTAGAAQTLQLLYGTAPIVVTTLMNNASIIAAATNYCIDCAVAPLNNQSIAAVENAAVNVTNPIATEISGNAANDNTITISLLYYTISI